MAMKLDHEDLNRLIDKISASDIQEFSLEGEDFKLEIKRNLLDQSQVTNNLISNNSFDRQTLSTQKPITDNASKTNEPQVPRPRPKALENGMQVEALRVFFVDVRFWQGLDVRS